MQATCKAFWEPGAARGLLCEIQPQKQNVGLRFSVDVKTPKLMTDSWGPKWAGLDGRAQ